MWKEVDINDYLDLEYNLGMGSSIILMMHPYTPNHQNISGNCDPICIDKYKGMFWKGGNTIREIMNYWRNAQLTMWAGCNIDALRGARSRLVSNPHLAAVAPLP